MSSMDNLLGGLTGNDSQKEWAHKLATLMSSAAYWASWADALHMIAERLLQGCIGELREAADRLDREGFVNRPEWIALKDVQRPEVVEMWELGEWHHGWQYYASSCSEYHYRETVVLVQSCAADQAHLRSGLPKGFRIPAATCRFPHVGSGEVTTSSATLRGCLRLRRKVGYARGRHRAACPRSGLLRIRATPTPHREDTRKGPS